MARAAGVIVSRQGGFWRDRLRAYRVKVDGRTVGKVREFDSLPVSLTPGVHEIQVKLDWGTSPRVVVNVERDEIQRLECGPGSILGMFVPGMYLKLRYSGAPDETPDGNRDDMDLE